MTALGRPPQRAREGHGQHLRLRSLVSDPDDRNADHLGLDAARRAVEPSVTIGRVNALMVSRASAVHALLPLLPWLSGIRGWLVSQDPSREYPEPGLGMPPVRLGLAWPCDQAARTIMARACSMVRTSSQVRLPVTRSRNRWLMRGHLRYPLPASRGGVLLRPGL